MTDRPVGSTDRPEQRRAADDAMLSAALDTAWAETGAPASTGLRDTVLRIPLAHPRRVVTDVSVRGVLRGLRLAWAPMALAAALGFVVGVTDLVPLAPSADTAVAIVENDRYITEGELELLMFGGAVFFEEDAS